MNHIYDLYQMLLVHLILPFELDFSVDDLNRFIGGLPFG
jgi:hypothetical protein